jgi:hypothetical protein
MKVFFSYNEPHQRRISISISRQDLPIGGDLHVRLQKLPSNDDKYAGYLIKLIRKLNYDEEILYRSRKLSLGVEKFRVAPSSTTNQSQGTSSMQFQILPNIDNLENPQLIDIHRLN